VTREQKKDSGPPVLEQAFFDTAPEQDQRAVVGRTLALKRLFRRMAPIMGLGGAGVLLVVFAYAGPWPATRADVPAFVDAARASGAALGRELGGAAPGPLRGSAGVFDMTPNPPYFIRLAGYPSQLRRSNVSEGKLLAWSWVVQAGSGPACAVMGADILMLTPALAHAVATEVDAMAHIPRDRVLFTASHTHSSVGGYGRTLAESYVLGANEESIDQISMRWAPTAWSAAENVRPAVIRAGQAHAAQLIHNRTEPGAPADPTVDVLQLDVDGEEPALLVLFGAHPTSQSHMETMSPDYPGPMRRIVSEHVGAFVSFAAGAVGSMGVKTVIGERTPETVGALLATPVMNAMRPRSRREEVKSMDARVACGRAHLPLPVPRVPVVGTLALTERASARLLEPPHAMTVSALVAGPVLLVSLPGELSGELSGALRTLARGKGYALALASFSGEYAGYLLPAERFGKGPERSTQLSGIGAGAPAVAFIEGLIGSLPQGPLPPETELEHVWPR